MNYRTINGSVLKLGLLLYLVRAAPHAGHVEEVLEGVGGAEELSEGGPGVPMEGVGEVGAASAPHVGGAATCST